MRFTVSADTGRMATEPAEQVWILGTARPLCEAVPDGDKEQSGVRENGSWSDQLRFAYKNDLL